MRIVLFSLVVFAAAFLLHMLLWRVWRPQRQILGLLVLFLGLAPLVPIMAWRRPDLEFWPADKWQWLHFAIFYVAAALSYIVTFSLLEQDSPSLTVVVFVAAAGDLGRTREELYALIGHDSIIGGRFESMVHGKLIQAVGDVYRLTPKGAFWAYLFLTYRRLLRLDLGG